MGNGRRIYSDQDKASALAALDANGGNLRKTADILGIPFTTLQRWKNGEAISADVPELRTDKKKELADKLMEVAFALVAAIPEKIKDAGLQQVSTSLGIAIEKLQLLNGEATARNDIGLTVNLPPLPDDQLDNIFSKHT